MNILARKIILFWYLLSPTAYRNNMDSIWHQAYEYVTDLFFKCKRFRLQISFVIIVSAWEYTFMLIELKKSIQENSRDFSMSIWVSPPKCTEPSLTAFCLDWLTQRVLNNLQKTESLQYFLIPGAPWNRNWTNWFSRLWDTKFKWLTVTFFVYILTYSHPVYTLLYVSLIPYNTSTSDLH